MQVLPHALPFEHILQQALGCPALWLVPAALSRK